MEAGPPPSYSKWVIEHLRIGDTFRLKIGKNGVGRNVKNQVKINSVYVSRCHAFINVSTDGEILEVIDNGSQNGTFVIEGRLDTISRKLKEGDIIGFGVQIEGEDIENDPSLPIYVVRNKPLPSPSTVAQNLNRMKNEMAVNRLAQIKQEAPAASRDDVQTVVTSSSSGDVNNAVITIDSDDENEIVSSTVCGENLTSNKDNNVTSKSDNHNESTTTVSNDQDIATKNQDFNPNIVIKKEQFTDDELENVAPAEVAETSEKQNLDGIISLLTDDEDENEETRETLTTAERADGLKKIKLVKNIFGDITDSLKKSLKKIDPSLADIAEQDKDNTDEEAYVVDISNEDDDCEEIMYSQALATDIKADFDELRFLNQENGEALTPERPNETAGDIQKSPIWVISSDDEGSDEECKDRVSGWSSRVFDHVSQIYHTQVDKADFESEEDERDELEDEETSPKSPSNLSDEDENRPSPLVQVEADNANKEKRKSVELFSSDDSVCEINDADVPMDNHIMDFDEGSTIQDDKDADLSPLKLTTHRKAIRLMSTDESDSDDKVVNQESVSKLYSHQIRECSIKLRRISVDCDLLLQKEPKKTIPPRRKSEFVERPLKLKPVSRGPLIIDAAPMHRRRSKNGTMVSLKRPHTTGAPNASEKEISNLEDQCMALDKRDDKIKRIRLEVKKASNNKTLKDKWLQKPGISKKEREKIKEKRKEKLSHIAEKEMGKRKDSSSDEKTDAAKASSSSKAKVKVTKTNRGAFLVEDINRNSNKNYRKQKEEEEKIKKEKIRKEAELIRAAQKPQKVSFARMESDFKETNKIEAKFKRLEEKKAKKCKNREVTLKAYNREAIEASLLQKSTHVQRREQWLKNYPKVDRTNDIISMILKYSNDWLPHRNVEFNAAAEPLVHKPKKRFLDFAEYQETFFSLMRLEYLSELERDMKSIKDPKPVPIVIETTMIRKNRLIITAKCRVTKVNATNKYDLVLLTFKGLTLETKETFAYLSSSRRFGQQDTLVLEVLHEHLTQENVQNATDVRLLSVTDNLQVTLGALNAIYQLEAAPLRGSIINPEALVSTKMELPSHSAIFSKTYDPVNSYQKAAILQTYLRAIQDESPTISLIKGPPGTGKSLVITNLILQLLYGHEVRKLDNKILICAQSNNAVDVIADSLYRILQHMTNVDDGLKYRVLRYGVYDRIAPHVRHISTQNLIEKELFKRLQQNDKAFENAKNMESHLCYLETEIQRISMDPLHDENEESKLKELKRQREKILEIKNKNGKSHDYYDLLKWFLAKANIVCVTLSSCIRLAQYIDYFDVCIIDEATQCTEPWTLIPLRFGISSLVLVGDSLQLPATVISKKAYDAGLGESMFTRIENCIESKAVKEKYPNERIIFGLRTQYRMHPEICQWPNTYFYKGLLKNSDSTLQHDSKILPYAVLHLEFSQSVARSQGKIQNPDEANFVAGLVKALGQHLPFETNSYGVITPYNYQKSVLSSTMKKLGLPSNIWVSTIDAYQGNEKDVIIVSNTRTVGVGFLGNYQRLNVAITRPKKCLIICGNFDDLETSKAWHALLKDARARGLYFNVKADHADNTESSVLEFLVKKTNLSV